MSGGLAEVAAIPVALAALSWVAAGVAGRLSLCPFAAAWVFFAAGSTVMCGFREPGAWTAVVAVNLPVAAACWCRSRGWGRHAGPVAFRAAAKEGR